MFDILPTIKPLNACLAHLENKMDIGIWIVAISFVVAILLFLLALIALIASNITRKNGRNEATDSMAKALRESILNTTDKATVMETINNSSQISKRLFKLFENLSLASLVTLGLGFILFLLSTFFIGI